MPPLDIKHGFLALTPPCGLPNVPKDTSKERMMRGVLVIFRCWRMGR